MEPVIGTELAGFRIVLVDDDDDARELLTTCFHQRAAEVHAAASGAEAFGLVQQHRPDVLISDIAMPAEDGYMLIRRVRALSEEEGGRTFAIAVTAHCAQVDRKRAIDAGFDAHHAKPLHLDKLIDLVATRTTPP